MLVTTSHHATASLANKAQCEAERFNGTWVPRQQFSLSALMSKYGDEQVLVVSEHDLKYFNGESPPLFFHPGTAIIRVKRLLLGQTDVLIELSGVRKGDSILDCTAGLGSDSIVFAFVVGASGEVTAIESEPIIGLLLQEGLRTYSTGVDQLNQAFTQIRVRLTDHLTQLQQMKDQSVDVVYFDPMFRSPIEHSSSISPLRGVANDNPLNLQTIVEAKRVARRKVILKEHRNSGEFQRLGFQRLVRSNSKIAYGVIER